LKELDGTSVVQFFCIPFSLKQTVYQQMVSFIIVLTCASNGFLNPPNVCCASSNLVFLSICYPCSHVSCSGSCFILYTRMLAISGHLYDSFKCPFFSQIVLPINV
jgi:hypothetical protein